MIRVMVVDDSPLVRKIAGDILRNDPAIEVVATAATAEIALYKLERERPDVITMDMEMPGMGGLAAIRQIMAQRPTPIIVLSAHARSGAELTLQALEAGAADFMLKPAASLSGGLDIVAPELVEKVKAASGIRLARPSGPGEPEADRQEPAWTLSSTTPGSTTLESGTPRPGADGHELVAIGTSTGGPVALKVVLGGLPGDFPLPIVVVQHMPPVFTRAFAERLNATCALEIKEAEEGDALLPGRVLIAPGDRHLVVQRAPSRAALHQREPVCGHRPSVDVLMHSVAREFGDRAIGVIMTGMGKDGADGIRVLRRSGGTVLAQDRESSVIYGMNREVIQNGDADAILGVERIAGELLHRACQQATG
jgi:two-component system chemotaxis response regulator CheB